MHYGNIFPFNAIIAFLSNICTIKSNNTASHETWEYLYEYFIVYAQK